MGSDGAMPDVRSLRIPLKYLAGLADCGDEQPVALGLERMLAMRAYMRAKNHRGCARRDHCHQGRPHGPAHRGHVPDHGDRELNQDCFVIPTAHRELGEDAYDLRGSCGFSFGNGCSDGRTETGLFGTPRHKTVRTPTEFIS